MSLLKVSHYFLEDWVFGYRDGTGVSHMRETLLNITPKSLMVCTIHMICEQQLVAATYSVSMVDCATEDYFQKDQQTREDPRKWQVPKVFFRSIPHPIKSASE
jgi:hypothetical protein